MGVFAGAPSASQLVGVATPIANEFGEVLPGTALYAYKFGYPSVEGSLVQILLTTDGTIYPPAIDGTPDARNVVLATSRIGYGISPTKTHSGRFSMGLSPRPGGNSHIFARVFNAATLDNASFYGDSQVYTVSSWRNEVFMADLTATDQPLDTADDDGDGVINSWERSNGTDRNAKDSDGDGFTDGEEMLAGTDALDPGSRLTMVAATPLGEDALVTWNSVDGIRYRLEYTAEGLELNPVYSLVDLVVAGKGSTTTVLVPGGMVAEQGSYRVVVIGE
jgi:hypothetical protein